MKLQKRKSARKKIDPIPVSEIVWVGRRPLAESGWITDVSTTGFRVLIHRKDILWDHLYDRLDWSQLKNILIRLWIPAMELELLGVIKRVRHVGHGRFELGCDYSTVIPDYWREIFKDLLPSLKTG